MHFGKIDMLPSFLLWRIEGDGADFYLAYESEGNKLQHKLLIKVGFV